MALCAGVFVPMFLSDCQNLTLCVTLHLLCGCGIFQRPTTYDSTVLVTDTITLFVLTTNHLCESN